MGNSEIDLSVRYSTLVKIARNLRSSLAGSPIPFGLARWHSTLAQTGTKRFVIFAAAAAIALLGLFATGPAATATGVPSGESGFLLGGTAQNAQDPENPANDVIKIDTSTPPFDCIAPAFLNCTFGTVSRRLNTKIALLDNMLEFKSYFADRTCGGGSPRIQLAIDLDGDGNSDGNAFGYTAPPFAGCAPNRWQYDDLTDELPRWDISQFVAKGFPSAANICANALFSSDPVVCPFTQHSGYIPWIVFKTVLNTLFPMHKICTGALVDDSSWAKAPPVNVPAINALLVLVRPVPTPAGVAYYDIISMGRATWEDREDSVGRGFAQGCGRVNDDPDDKVDGDCDHDHDHDSDDQEFDQKRHERWH